MKNDASIIQMLESGKNDLAWFQSNLNKIRLEYNNRFIAFYNGAIIESDPNLDNLMEKLKNKKVDTSNIFIKFVSKIKAIL